MKIKPMVRGLEAVLLSMLVGGCAAEPFERLPLPILANPNPTAIRAEFAGQLTDHFITDDTVIIQAPFRDDVAVLGVLRADRAGRSFQLVGMNHLGVKFFQLESEGGNATIQYAVPPLMEQKELLLSVAADTQRMYFDLVPSREAMVDVGPTVVRFRQNTAEGTLVYEFGGTPAVLLEKRLEGFYGAIWRVRYYDYGDAQPGLYPRGLVMDNKRFGYRIIVKNRAWQARGS